MMLTFKVANNFSMPFDWLIPLHSCRPRLLSELGQGSDNRRPLAVELGRLLESMTDPYDPGLVERLADDLEGERQPALKADRDGKGGTTGQIVGTGIRSSLVDAPERHLIDAWRRPGRIRRDRDIHIGKSPGKLEGELPSLPHRLDIVRRAQESAECDPGEHVMAEKGHVYYLGKSQGVFFNDVADGFLDKTEVICANYERPC